MFSIAVPENDRRNKYTVKVEGLDDEGRLAAPLDSDLNLNIRVLGKFLCYRLRQYFSNSSEIFSLKSFFSSEKN